METFCKNGIAFGIIEDQMAIALVESEMLREDTEALLAKVVSDKKHMELIQEKTGIFLKPKETK